MATARTATDGREGMAAASAFSAAAADVAAAAATEGSRHGGGGGVSIATAAPRTSVPVVDGGKVLESRRRVPPSTATPPRQHRGHRRRRRLPRSRPVAPHQRGEHGYNRCPHPNLVVPGQHFHGRRGVGRRGIKGPRRQPPPRHPPRAQHPSRHRPRSAQPPSSPFRGQRQVPGGAGVRGRAPTHHRRGGAAGPASKCHEAAPDHHRCPPRPVTSAQQTPHRHPHGSVADGPTARTYTPTSASQGVGRAMGVPVPHGWTVPSPPQPPPPRRRHPRRRGHVQPPLSRSQSPPGPPGGRPSWHAPRRGSPSPEPAPAVSPTSTLEEGGTWQ